MRERVTVVTLSVTLSVALSVCHFSILEEAPFSVLNLHRYVLGDDLSVLNVALFLKIEAILEKKRVELRP